MPTNQRLTLLTVDPTTAGWDAIITTNFNGIQQFFDDWPTTIRAVYRDRALNPSPGTFRNLGDFLASTFHGAMVFVVDTDGSDGNDPPLLNGARYPYAWSDGINWRWANDNKTVGGIT